jgi:hypothetical protein
MNAEGGHCRASYRQHLTEVVPRYIYSVFPQYLLTIRDEGESV